MDSFDHSVKGAEFTLAHDEKNCSICRGNNTAVPIDDFKATSDAEGKVSFINIPSGHKYILEETKVPDGYAKGTETYSVEVAYNKLTVKVKNNGSETTWDNEQNNTIVNKTSRELPSTGGTGTTPYTLGGLLFITIASPTLMYIYKKRRREA